MAAATGAQGQPLICVVAGAIYYSLDQGVTWTEAQQPGSPSNSAAPVSGDGTIATPFTIAAGAIALTKLATQADQTALINVSGGAASPVAGTATQLTALINPATSSLPGAMTAALFGATQGLVTAFTAKIDLTAASATYSFTPALVKPGFLFIGQRAVTLFTTLTGTASVGLTYSVGNDASFLNIVASSSISSTVINNAQAAGAPIPPNGVNAINGAVPVADATAEIKYKVITPVVTGGTCVGRLVVVGTWVPV